MALTPENLYFVRNFTHTIDSQRRFAIPSEWRSGKGAEDRFVLLPAKDNLIQMIPEVTFQREILEKAKKLSLADARGMRDLALLGSRASACGCDKQGRIQLTPSMMKYANLTNQVVLVGSLWCIQLWNPEKWAPYAQENEAEGMDDAFFDILEKINNKENP